PAPGNCITYPCVHDAAHGLVECLLWFRELNPFDNFSPRRQLGSNSLFGPAQQEGAYTPIEPRLCAWIPLFLDWGAKQLLEGLSISQEAGIDPVKQRPEVLQRVLHWSAG